jgi:catechol 2,3-dioxygenase
METRGVGHVVLKVRDLEKSAKFYQDVFGLKEVARLGKQMAFFSFGKNHHDLGLMALGSQAPAANPYATGLYHVAFRIGNNIEDLRKFKKH